MVDTYPVGGSHAASAAKDPAASAGGCVGLVFDLGVGFLVLGCVVGRHVWWGSVDGLRERVRGTMLQLRRMNVLDGCEGLECGRVVDLDRVVKVKEKWAAGVRSVTAGFDTYQRLQEIQH